ncbi:hypothetical protein FHS68_003865 [Dyadobacter arcticus]|uniref:Transposase n=1 Tax=Dyadobacter arcticus TaxID=1078754 RepID=A0ABX0UNW9_9BACT|nr:hypothetical protein [Dyadobacter arcticus]
MLEHSRKTLEPDIASHARVIYSDELDFGRFVR